MKIIIKKNNIKILITQLIVFIILNVCLIVSDFTLEVWSPILVFVFIQALVISIYGGFLNLLQVYLFFVFLFNLVIPFLIMINIYEYPAGNRIMASDGIKMPLSDRVIAETYAAISFSLIGISLGWVVSKISLPTSIKVLKQKKEGLIDIVFYIFWCLNIINSILMVQRANEIGYIAAIHLREGNSTISQLLLIFTILYNLIGSIFIFKSDTSLNYIKRALLFILPYLILSVSGARGTTIAISFSLIVLYQYWYHVFKVRYFFLLIIFFFITGVFIGASRFDYYSIDGLDIFLDPSLILYSLISTGSSIGVIAYTISLENEFFNKVPFFFGYIEAIFSFASNYTEEGLRNKSYLAQHLMYLLDRESFFNGSTIGSALVAELYELSHGILPIISILSFFIIFIGSILLRKSTQSPLFFYICLTYISVLMISPRDSVMRIIDKEFIFSIIIYLIFFFIKILKNHLIKLP